MTEIEREMKLIELKAIIEGEQRRVDAMYTQAHKAGATLVEQGLELTIIELDKALKLINSIK